MPTTINIEQHMLHQHKCDDIVIHTYMGGTRTVKSRHIPPYIPKGQHPTLNYLCLSVAEQIKDRHL